ncbi:protein rolling stone-like [Styela clava]
MALNSLGWTIAYYIWYSSVQPWQITHSYWFLTPWADFLRTTYFIAVALLVVIGMLNQLYMVEEQGGIKWLRGITWLFFTLTVGPTFVVTILFWSYVAPDLDPDIAYSVISIFRHGISFALLLIDLFVSAFPVRIAHGVYMMALAAFYGIFTIILWRAKVTDAVYGILDWEKYPELASGIIVAVTLIAAPCIHLALFLLYRLRMHVYNRYHMEESSSHHAELKTLDQVHEEQNS